MAMTTCKECKAQISTTAEACPQCGAKPKKTSGCAIIVAALVGFFVLSAIVRGCTGNTTSTTATSTATGTQTSASEPPKTDPQTVLAEYQKTVEEIESRLKQNADHLNKYYGTPNQVKQATADLLKLAVVQGLYEESDIPDEKKLGIKAANLIPSIAQQQRTIYASATEEIFIKSGMDVRVSAVGAKKDQLRLKYVLMSQPLVYKLQNEVKLPEQARTLGFKKIIYSDGYNETWNVDL